MENNSEIKTLSSFKTDTGLELVSLYSVGKENILLSYSGPIESDTIKIFGDKVKRLSEQYQQAGRKLFFTFVELAQNISFYSNEKSKIGKSNPGSGTLLVGENKENFFFITGNIVNFNFVKSLERKISIINSLDREELRLYKKEQRNLIPGSKGNAHIGLIMTALTTKNKLQTKISKVDNKRYFFSIFVEINKQ